MSPDSPDPYSLPFSPAWLGEAGGQRIPSTNRALRAIPRPERVLEIYCGARFIAAVTPRGHRKNWRLFLLDHDEHLWRTDAPPRLSDNDERDERAAGFRCLCGRFHVLDRDAVLRAAEEHQPKRPGGRAGVIQLIDVARVLREGAP